MATLNAPRLKLQRARHHLEDIHHRVQDFIALDPCKFRIDPHPEPPQYAVRGYVNRPVPAEIGVVVGDFVHNARSALDLLVYAISSLDAASPARGDLQFPITTTPEQFNDQVKKRRRLGGVPEPFVKIIEASQPYEGRSHNSPMKFVQSLSNRDKHRLITTTSAVGRDAKLQIETQDIPQVGNIVISGSGRLCSDLFDIQFVENAQITENGAAIAYFTHVGGDFKLNPEIAIDIQFADGHDEVEGRNVTDTLALILAYIEQVIGKCEHEQQR